MPFERFPVSADDGFALAAAHQPAAGHTTVVLQILHGMAEHIERYRAFAEACAARGIAVYGHDHRGHGRSVDATTPLGHYADQDGWRKVVDDVSAVHRRLRQDYPTQPVVLLAHSMGSIIGRTHLLRYPDTFAGAVISATNARLGVRGLTFNRWLRRQAERIAAESPRAPSQKMSDLVFGLFNVPFSPRTTGFEWLSRDPHVVREYVDDPLCGFPCSGTLWRDLLSGVIALERQEDDGRSLSATLPILLIAGSRDPVSLGGLGHWQLAKRYRAAGNPHVERRRFPKGRHELLNETNRDEVWRVVIEWVAQRAR